MTPASFDQQVSDQLKFLKSQMATQDSTIQPLINTIQGMVDRYPFAGEGGLGAFVDNLVQIQAASTEKSAIVKGIVGTSIVDLATAQMQIERYLGDTEPLVAMDVDTLTISTNDRAAVQVRLDTFTAARALLADSNALAGELLGLGGAVGAAVVGQLRPPTSSDTSSPTAFAKYLDSQVAAAQALQGSDTIPSEALVDNLTKGLAKAIEGGFPGDTRSREQQVADSCSFQDSIDELIGLLDEVVGDRDLLNPAIL
jgi:hypothetical protein